MTNRLRDEFFARVGKKIQSSREKNQLTQEDISKHTGIDIESIEMVEKGIYNSQISLNISKLMTFMNVSVKEILQK